MNQRGYDTQSIRRIERHHRLRTRRHGDEQAIPTLQTDGRQGIRALIDLADQLALVRRAVKKIPGDRVGAPACRGSDRVVECYLGILEGLRYGAVMAKPRAVVHREC